MESRSGRRPERIRLTDLSREGTVKVVKTDAEISCAIDELERQALSLEGVSLLAGDDIQIVAEELMAERTRQLIVSHFGDWTISELMRLQGRVTDRQTERRQRECPHPAQRMGLTQDGRRECRDCGMTGSRVFVTETH